MKGLIAAFSMYSILPMPAVKWEKKTLAWALCWFPLVGVLIGGVLRLWMAAARGLHMGPVFFAAFALSIPIILSGGVHLDGFCDTCDALASHQSREKKLEILKDSHIGAFAVMGCALYLLIYFACWCEVEPTGQAAIVLSLGPVLVRSLSGLFAVTLPNARGSGLLAAFTAPMDAGKARVILTIWGLACAAAMLWLGRWTGAAALIGSALVSLYYVIEAKRQFGGVTGDLAGFFLQLCELAVALSVVILQKIEVWI